MRVFLILFIVLASYGSLYPFDFEFSIHSESSLFAPLWDNALGSQSIGDIFGNIVLFLPFGVLISANNKSNRSNNIALFLSGIALATFLQFLQLYTPSRDPNLRDVIWNITGISAGFLIGKFFNRQHNQNTQIQFEWNVQTTKPWMTMIANVAQPIFKWNHRQVMCSGEQSLIRRLNSSA